MHVHRHTHTGELKPIDSFHCGNKLYRVQHFIQHPEDLEA